MSRLQFHLEDAGNVSLEFENNGAARFDIGKHVVGVDVDLVGCVRRHRDGDRLAEGNLLAQDGSNLASGDHHLDADPR